MQTITELFDLSGKNALVTGGGIGIGQAIVLRLAEAGAKVMIADIDTETAGQTAQLVQSSGGTAQIIEADACCSDHATKAVQATVEAFGSIDVLVNNAGIYPVSPVMDTSEELINKVIELNLKGSFLFAQAAAREMIKAGNGGKIVNMASTDGIRPSIGFVHYSASKGGVIMLTKALALELAPHNILVNAVAPSGILTPGTLQTQDKLLAATGKTVEDLADNFFQRMPLGRMGEPEEVANAVFFLTSAAANYITGEIMVVDGGYLLS
ncbi:SDR family NAD(P)-dependent oxidoreductase [Chloroflexota bacterium]